MMTSREDMIRAMDAIQTERCGYSQLVDGTLRQSSFCDCKFGLSRVAKGHLGEQNGCPELRVVSQLLSNMTDDEFWEICNRKQ